MDDLHRELSSAEDLLVPSWTRWLVGGQPGDVCSIRFVGRSKQTQRHFDSLLPFLDVKPPSQPQGSGGPSTDNSLRPGMGMEGVSCVSTRAQSLSGHEDGRQIRPSPDPSPGVAAASGDAVTERGRAGHGGPVTATLYG
jgi:hypothetical protein